MLIKLLHEGNVKVAVAVIASKVIKTGVLEVFIETCVFIDTTFWIINFFFLERVYKSCLIITICYRN
jgi:hypothetical protein